MARTDYPADRPGHGSEALRSQGPPPEPQPLFEMTVINISHLRVEVKVKEVVSRVPDGNLGPSRCHTLEQWPVQVQSHTGAVTSSGAVTHWSSDQFRCSHTLEQWPVQVQSHTGAVTSSGAVTHWSSDQFRCSHTLEQWPVQVQSHTGAVTSSGAVTSCSCTVQLVFGYKVYKNIPCLFYTRLKGLFITLILLSMLWW